MTQGTTPTVKLHLNGTEADLTDAARVRVIFSQGDQVLKVDGPGPRVEVEPNTVTVTLTQEETLLFSPGTLMVQVRWTLEDGTTAATLVTTMRVHRTLDKEIL